MALAVKDRVRETSVTSGTGTLTLAGPVASFQSFSAIGNGNTTYYCIVDSTTNDWEVGIGTYTASGTTLSRDVILASSNGGSAVFFSSNPKDVFCTYPAEKAIYDGGPLGTPSSGTLTNATGLPISTGVSGLGTGVATALAVNTGSAGAFVIYGGALGTPSSGTLSSCTGLPISTGVSGLGTGVATALAVNTGSAGAFVIYGGALGTPSSGTLSSCTGLPISTGVSGLGTGVASALAVNTNSAGAFVIYGGALGTPSSGTLSSCTGLPISTGVSGLGTGVATALAVNTGTAGAFVVNGGALGTPSSGTLSSCTGLPISTGVSGLGTGVATALAVNTGTAGAFVVNGGALGTPSSGTLTSCTGLPLSTGVTGTLGITNGGTGQTTAGAAFNALSPITTTGDLIIGNGANSATRLAIGANGYVLQSNGTTASWASVSGTGDVVGPASSTDNAVVRFDGTTGKLIQNSAVTIADTTGDITGGKYNGLTVTTTTGTFTLTNAKTLSVTNTLTLSGTDSTTITFPSTSQTIVGLTATQTLTNKTVTPRTTSVTSITSPFGLNTDGYDVYAVTAQASDLTINADTGTPTDGQKFIFRVTSDATPRVITFTGGSNKSFKPVGTNLTTSGSNFTYTLTASKTTYFGCIYNTTSVRWEMVALSQEA